jgi:hypothetical protein
VASAGCDIGLELYERFDRFAESSPLEYLRRFDGLLQCGYFATRKGLAEGFSDLVTAGKGPQCQRQREEISDISVRAEEAGSGSRVPLFER